MASAAQVGVFRLAKEYYVSFYHLGGGSIRFISNNPNKNLQEVAEQAQSFAISRGFSCNTTPQSLSRPWIVLAKDNQGCYWPVKLSSNEDFEPIIIAGSTPSNGIDVYKIASKANALALINVAAEQTGYVPFPGMEIPVEQIVFDVKMSQ